MECPYCHSGNPDEAAACAACGKPLSAVTENFAEQQTAEPLSSSEANISPPADEETKRKRAKKIKGLILCAGLVIWGISLICAVWFSNIYRSPESVATYYIQQSNRPDYKNILRTYPPECRDADQQVIKENNADMRIELKETYGEKWEAAVTKTTRYTIEEVRAQAKRQGEDSDWAKWQYGMEWMCARLEFDKGLVVKSDDCYMVKVHIRGNGSRSNRNYDQYVVVVKLAGNYYVCPTEYTPGQ